jgi:DNA-binding NtrC family response regulator
MPRATPAARILRINPRRLAWPAPTPRDEPVDPPPSRAEQDLDQITHLLAEAWGGWVRSRRLYARTGLPACVLGRLTARTRSAGSPADGPDAPAGAELAAFHLAVISQPADALDRQVFELHYRFRVGNIKAAARELGIGRQHWYTLLRSFRRRVYCASRELMSDGQGSFDSP